MSDNADQVVTNVDTTDGHWLAWRWVIAGSVVVVLAFVFWLASSRGPQVVGTSPATAALDLSVQQYRAGQYEDAVASAKAALQTNPESFEAYNNLAVSYLGLRRFDEAVAAAQDAIRLAPDFQLAKNNLAWIQREKAQASGGSVQAAPVARSPAAAALLNQSLEHSQAGRYKECMDSAAQSAKLDPSSARAFSNIGFCAGKLGLWDEATRNLQEAVRLDPNFQLAKNNLAWAQQEKSRAEAAKGR